MGGAATMAAVGDGVVAVALPLLTTAVTRDPLAVAGVVAAQQVAWVVVALTWHRLPGDRRTLIGGADALRAIVVGILGALAVLGRETILTIQVVAFIVGLGEALTDRVESESADVSRVSTRGMLAMAAVGLPLGGVLYEIFPATPFVFDVLAFAFAGLLALFALSPTPTPAPPAAIDDELPGHATSFWTLASVALTAAATSGIAAVVVLFAIEDLALGAPAFGLVLAGMAGGATVGGLVAPELGGGLGLRGGIAAALVVAGAAVVAASQLADPALPWLAAAALAVASAATMAASVLTRAQLQLSRGRPATAQNLRPLHLAMWIAGPVGALAAGWLAAQRSVPDAVLASGVALVAASFVSFLCPSRKSVDEQGQLVVEWSQSTNSSGTRTSEEV